MITLIRSVVSGQYGAALSMLQGCIDRADAPAWLAAAGKFPFWHVAYHTLFFTDLYLSPDESAFRPQPFHREGYNFLGAQPWAPDKQIVADLPHDKQTLATYVASCRAKAKTIVQAESQTSLEGPSGFWWLKFTRLELHLYNIRHIQHHTGQLGALLRRQGCEGVGWVMSEEL